MPARNNNWRLVGMSEDPAPGDPTAVGNAIEHFRHITNALVDQAMTLQIIEKSHTSLEGKYADEIRKLAKDMSGDLGKAAARYHDVASALATYRPALEHVRSETLAAVEDAEREDRVRHSALGAPDPVGESRPPDALPLSEAQKQQSNDRKTAISSSEASLAAATARARRAADELNDAAAAMARDMKKAWNIDGLHTTWIQGQLGWLKELGKILGWIGLALAAIALVITGVGAMAILGIVVTVFSVVVNLILAIHGETSWLNFALAATALFSFGVGGAAATAIGKTQQTLVKANMGKLTRNNVDLTKKLKKANDKVNDLFASPNGSFQSLQQQIFKRNDLAIRLRDVRQMRSDLLGAGAKPTWWNVIHPAYGKVNLDALKRNWSEMKPLSQPYPKALIDVVGTKLLGFSGIGGLRASPMGNVVTDAGIPLRGTASFPVQGSGFLSTGSGPGIPLFREGSSKWTFVGSGVGGMVPPSTAFVGTAVGNLGIAPEPKTQR